MGAGHLLAACLLGPPASDPGDPADPAAAAASTDREVEREPAPPRRRARLARIPAIGPVQPWLRTQSFVEYFRENFDQTDRNDGFVAVVNRANLGWDAHLKRSVTLHNAFRVDTQNLLRVPAFACDEDEDGVVDSSEQSQCRFADDYRLERATFRVDSRFVSATAGDFPAQFGRGIPLAVRKVDQLGVDATIKGGRVDLHAGPVEIIGLAGYANAQNSDFATRRLVEDPGYPGPCSVADRPPIGNPGWTVCSDLITAGRVQARLPRRIDLGAHYGHIRFGRQVSPGIDERIHLAGADVERHGVGGVWNVFGGATALVRIRDAPDADIPSLEGVDYVGHAAYMGNTLIFDSTTAVIEVEQTRDYLVALLPSSVQYAAPPSLEREDQVVPGPFNATGGRVRVDHTWRESGFTLFANGLGYAFSEAIQEEPFDPEQGRVATHVYAGAIWRDPATTLQVSSGYRHEWRVDDGHFRRRFPHVELYGTAVVARGRGLVHSVSVRGETRFEDRQIGPSAPTRHFSRGFVQLGYSMAPWVQLSFIGGFSTEFAAAPGTVDLTGRACEPQFAPCKPHLWPGAELRITVHANNFVRVFAGRGLGGLVCVNGSCRTLPDFEGVRTELVLSF